MIAAVATMIFMVATFGLMAHAGALVLVGGSIAWLAAWLLPIGIAAVTMAVLNEPSPIWENDCG